MENLCNHTHIESSPLAISTSASNKFWNCNLQIFPYHSGYHDIMADLASNFSADADVIAQHVIAPVADAPFEEVLISC
jgi:hypothetical protein